MKKSFIYPEIKTADFSSVEAIMTSSMLVDVHANDSGDKKISYTLTDNREDADKLKYWAGRN